MNFYTFFSDKIKNKNILILGLGKEGKSSLSILLKLKSKDYKKIAIADKLPQNLDFLYDYAKKNNIGQEKVKIFIENIIMHVGADYLSFLNEYDFILKAPGVVLPKNTNLLSIKSQMQIFTEYYREQIIGITGTKGKSTTASLMHHILKENNISSILAGNIGIPVFDIIDEINKDTKIILEMSAHQLEYMNISPKIAILLNLYEEHLDHYKTFENYCNAKYNIFNYMKKDDILIATSQIFSKNFNLDIEKIFASFENQNIKTDIIVNNRGFYYKNHFYEVPYNISLKGVHNIYNISCIYIVLSKFISYKDFINSIYNFTPLPHRLQFIGRYNDIDFYDDSISTMGESTIQAIKSIKNADCILIGGMDRGISYDNLINFMIKHNEYKYILMEATGYRIYNELKQRLDTISSYKNIILTKHLSDAINIAFQITDSKKACILSPAAASYGIFKNFEHRGEIFNQLVKNHK